MTYTQIWNPMTNEVHDGIILRDEDQAHIPMDADNKDCQEYMAWLEEGNEPNPPIEPPDTETEPTPDISEVHAQVQDIDQRLSDLEGQVANVQEASAAFQKSMRS